MRVEFKITSITFRLTEAQKHKQFVVTEVWT